MSSKFIPFNPEKFSKDPIYRDTHLKEEIGENGINLFSSICSQCGYSYGRHYTYRRNGGECPRFNIDLSRPPEIAINIKINKNIIIL